MQISNQNIKIYPIFKIRFYPKIRNEKLATSPSSPLYFNHTKAPFFTPNPHISPSKNLQNSHIFHRCIFTQKSGGGKIAKKVCKMFRKSLENKRKFYYLCRHFEARPHTYEREKELKKQTESLRLDRLNTANSLK